MPVGYWRSKKEREDCVRVMKKRCSAAAEQARAVFVNDVCTPLFAKHFPHFSGGLLCRAVALSNLEAAIETTGHDIHRATPQQRPTVFLGASDVWSDVGGKTPSCKR